MVGRVNHIQPRRSELAEQTWLIHPCFGVKTIGLTVLIKSLFFCGKDLSVLANQAPRA